MFKSYTSRARQSYSRHSTADYNPGAPPGRVTPGTQKQTTTRELLPEGWCRELLPAHNEDFNPGATPGRLVPGATPGTQKQTTIRLV